jgi:threonine dehydrogenase-like Zn-dependent dehydrogenase
MMHAGQEYAVAFTGLRKAELVPVERDPAPLGAAEVEGRTLYTLISTGTKLAGGYEGSRFPSYPGYAGVFQVQGVGSEVTDLRPGDLAYCMGPHRSFQRVPAERALRVPEGLVPEAAPFARLIGVSMTTLTTRARPPQRVLVTGLGLVGHLAAQVFSSCGYRVTACDPDARRRMLAEKQGIADVREQAPQEFTDASERFALALECSGHEQAALTACRAVRKGGEVALVGCPWQQRTELTAHELLSLVFHGYVHLRSGWEWELPLHEQEFRANSIFGNQAAALDWLARGRVRVEGLFQRAEPQACGPVYEQLREGRAESLGVLFDWTSAP